MECSVCLERYQATSPHRPVVLPQCGHTFCELCILKLYNSSLPLSAACPTCRVPLPTNRELLLPNYALLSLLSEQSRRRSRRGTTRQPGLSARCDYHPGESVSLFCVQCEKFVCRSCCSDTVHVRLPISAIRTQCGALIAPLVEELTTAQTTTEKLIPLLKQYQDKHAELFSTAASQADALFVAGIEELQRQRQLVATRLQMFEKDWQGFWRSLITAASSHAGYLEEQLCDILKCNDGEESLSRNNSSDIDFVSKQPHSNGRKRFRRDTENNKLNSNPSDPESPSSKISFNRSPTEIRTNDSESSSVVLSQRIFQENDPNCYFLHHLQQLSLHSTNVTVPSPPNIPASLDPSLQLRIKEVCGAILVQCQCDNKARPDNVAVRSSSPVQRDEANDRRAAESALHRLALTWQTYRNVEALRQLFSLFKFPVPRPPPAFSAYVPPMSVNPPRLTVVFPEVFPGIMPPVHELLNIQCRTLEL